MNQEITKSESQALEQQGERLPISRFALFFALLVGGLTADLWTKTYFFKNYFDVELANQNQAQAVNWWIDGIFGIQTSTNAGALFGLGQGYSWLFAILSIGALFGVIAWLFVWGAARDRWITVALGLISGGILGNLYDRLGFGYVEGWPEHIRDNVRDFAYFRLENVPMFDPWPNFNIADAVLVTGAIMLFVHALFLAEPEKPRDAK